MTLKGEPLGRYLSVARAAAVDAGDFLRRNQRRIRTIRTKPGEGNLVTDMDRRAEERIVRALQRAFPGHEIFAEERPAVRTGAPYRWHVDPLDGTTNYAHGFPFYSVSIALEIGGRLAAGVVYRPEGPELFEAVHGRGAWRNGKRIGPSRCRRLADALLVTGFSYDPAMKRRNLRYFCRFMEESRAIRRVGSAALDLCYTACGIFDGFWEFALAPWDLAAGTLICHEAGVRVTALDGGPFDLYGGEVLAANRALHRRMQEVIRSVR